MLGTFRVTQDDFSHVRISVYKTGSVVVQPHSNKKSVFIERFLSLRAEKLRSKGKSSKPIKANIKGMNY